MAVHIIAISGATFDAGSWRHIAPREVVQRLAQIETRFRVESPCEQELIFSAAAKVVLQNELRIQEFLARPFSAAQ